MSRYATQQATPSQPTIEGDESFTGMNMTLERSALGPGQYSLAINKRVNRGVVETRPGVVTPVFANILPYTGGIVAAGVYNNPNGQKVGLLALPGLVRMIHDGSYPIDIPIYHTVTLSGEVSFSQQFDKVLLHRAGGATLEWDGVSSAGFIIGERPPVGDTSVKFLPNAPWGINFGGRAIVPVGRDELQASDIGDYTIVDPILNKFRVNAGTGDAIVGAYPYANNNIIVGKEESFDVLVNFVGDLSAASAQVLSASIGLASRKAMKMMGSDYIFPSRNGRGIYRINQTLDSRLQAPPLPVGATADSKGRVIDPIAPLLERVNWPYASASVAGVLPPYYIWFFPLDDSKVNNAAAIYNVVTDQWESYDLWLNGLHVEDILEMDYLGQPALYGVNRGGVVYVLYVGTEDELSYNRVTGLHTVFPMKDVLETRGYATLGWNAARTRDFRRSEVLLKTQRPSVTVTQIFDGANDERLLTSRAITKNRRKYYQWGKADYATRNTNGDFHDPGREDYSVVPEATGISPKNGITPGLKQTRSLKFSTRARGGFVSYRIENTQGQCDVVSVMLESAGVQREMRGAA